MLVNGDILSANYGVKQRQFTNQIQNPVLVTLKNLMRPNKDSLQNQLQNSRASDPEESNEAFDRVIRGWLLYCSQSSIIYRH